MSASSQTADSPPAGLPILPVTRPTSGLVIGGGVAGLISLRNFTKPSPEGENEYCSAQNCSEKGKAVENVELWERRDEVGGVW